MATPVAAPEAPMQEHEPVFLLNFADELRRKVPIGGMRPDTVGSRFDPLKVYD